MTENRSHTGAVAKPGRLAPDLSVPLAGGGQWILADRKPPFMTLISFYRGFHCPRCKLHLADLAAKKARFDARGVDLFLVSCDPQDRAEKAADAWGLKDFDVGYDLSLDSARQWGLFISNAINEREPRQFSEPGMALVRPDGVLFSITIGSTPFHRPLASDILEALETIKARNYPPRGDA